MLVSAQVIYCVIYFIRIHLEEIIHISVGEPIIPVCVLVFLYLQIGSLDTVVRIIVYGSEHISIFLMVRKDFIMNLHKTEIEIVHSAYHHLWEQMQTKRLAQRTYGTTKQASSINSKKASKHKVSSL